MDPAAFANAAASAAASAAATAVRASPPAVISATMTCDGEVLGRIAARAQNGAAASSGTQVPIAE